MVVSNFCSLGEAVKKEKPKQVLILDVSILHFTYKSLARKAVQSGDLVLHLTDCVRTATKIIEENSDIEVVVFSSLQRRGGHHIIDVVKKHGRDQKVTIVCCSIDHDEVTTAKKKHSPILTIEKGRLINFILGLLGIPEYAVPKNI